MYDWISELYKDPDMLRMGHCQTADDLNLGMGWLYYGFARLIRPQKIVVIGSYRGFSPLVFSKALIDNGEGGVVHFIDPSLADDFWKDADRVNDYFVSHGVDNIRHYLMTTQQFVASSAYNNLSNIGIVFVDGLHTSEQAKYDYEAFRHLLAPNGIFLFHDSFTNEDPVNRLYPDEMKYTRTVKVFIDSLKINEHIQVFDLPFAKGLSLVRFIQD
jgi:predicted O-methyltransferase YrrM